MKVERMSRSLMMRFSDRLSTVACFTFGIQQSNQWPLCIKSQRMESAIRCSQFTLTTATYQPASTGSSALWERELERLSPLKVPPAVVCGRVIGCGFLVSSIYLRRPTPFLFFFFCTATLVSATALQNYKKRCYNFSIAKTIHIH